MRMQLEDYLSTYKVNIVGKMVKFKSDVKEFETEYPLSFLMELYKHNLLFELFVLPGIVPN